MRRAVWVMAAVMALGVQPAWAARTAVHEAAESPVYQRKAGGMIGRGLLNAATCFVDVIVNIVNGTKAGPPVVGTLTGVAKGAACGVLRLGSGVVDVTTFWVPGFNGFPVSDSYDDCLAVQGPSASMMQGVPPTAGELEPASAWQAPSAEPTATPAAAPSPEPAKKSWSK